MCGEGYQVPDHHYVERVETRDSGNYGVIIAAALVLLVVMAVVFFTLLGGASRFGSTTPSQTNVNVPAQQQPQQPSGPNIQVPRQIDVNVNAPAQQAPAQQAPAPPPVQQAPAQQPAQQAPAQQAPAGAQPSGSGR
jgi:hypothetical protein